MNAKELSKRIGSNFKLRPLPFRIQPDGTRLPPMDDTWELVEVKQRPAGLKLRNTRTDHVLKLESDNIQEYRSPEFLMLRCEVTIHGNAIRIEPVSKGAPIRPAPVSFASMQAEIENAPLASRSQLRDSFRGLFVECRGQLGSVTPVSADQLRFQNPVATDQIRVGIMEDSGPDIFFYLKPEQYPRLMVARRGERVTVLGKYERDDIGGVWLNDAELTFDE